MKTTSFGFDADLINKYDKSGPRYTSYPTVVEFSINFTAEDYKKIAQATNAEDKLRPLSLYFHIPFCDTVCFYCGCNKIATKDRSKSPPYLARLYRELAMQSKLFDDSRVVDQLHWGGGTPTFLNDSEIKALMARTRQEFNLREDDKGEYSIEIDPREAGRRTIELLRSEGFNRISLGLQDFEPKVQQAVNRVQTETQTLAVLNAAREFGFHSISIDLIYGLPLQTVKSFTETLHRILSIRPDRLSVFNYAHLPKIFKPQRRINDSDLPSSEHKLEILQAAMRILQDAGYVYIGMDHFALPEDELAIAQSAGSLYRNFQGYSTHKECDLIGFGVSSISMVGNCYAQNAKDLIEYEAQIDVGKLAVFRGIELDSDDILRREVITEIICNFYLKFSVIANKYQIDFSSYFAFELTELADMHEDGLIELGADYLKVLPAGRLLVRNICMVFDKYLRSKTNASFSRVI